MNKVVFVIILKEYRPFHGGPKTSDAEYAQTDEVW